MLKFWPSMANIWASYEGCTGFAKLYDEINPPIEINEIAKKGIELHDLASKVLLNLPMEIDENLTYYVNECNKLKGNQGVERKLSYCEINTKIDFDNFNKEYNKLTIIDLKTGAVPIKAFSNWQLITMCFVYVNNFKLPNNINIDLRIIQPYVFTGKKDDIWSVTLQELKPYFDQIIYAIKLANSETAILKTGDHCKYCPVLSKCSAAMNAGVTLFEVASKISIDRSINIGKRLSYIDRAFNHLKSLKKIYDVEATEKLKRGDIIEGYCLISKNSSLQWSISDDKIDNLGTAYNLNLFKKTALTPLQVIGKGISTTIINKISHTTSKKVLNKLNVDDLLKVKRESIPDTHNIRKNIF